MTLLAVFSNPGSAVSHVVKQKEGCPYGRVHVQAVPLGTSSAAPAGDGAHSPSTYEWSEQLSDGTLLAVGGGAPSTVHLWNLQQEICIEQVWP